MPVSSLPLALILDKRIFLYLVLASQILALVYRRDIVRYRQVKPIGRTWQCDMSWLVQQPWSCLSFFSQWALFPLSYLSLTLLPTVLPSVCLLQLYARPAIFLSLSGRMDKPWTKRLNREEVCRPTANKLHNQTDSKQIFFFNVLIKLSDQSHNLVLVPVYYAVISRVLSLTSNRDLRKAGSRCCRSSPAEISVTMELLDVKPLNDLLFHCVASGSICSFMLTGLSAFLM